MHSLNGKQIEFGIEPLFNSFLGSGSEPSNLPLLLASITVNSFLIMFSSICFLFFIRLIFSLV